MSALTLQVDGEVATITLDRPDAGNALDLDVAEGLKGAVTELHSRQGVKAVLLRGRGRMFCAGGDVRAIATADQPSAYLHRLVATLNEALLSLADLVVPVVAAVQGPAAGGGLGLVLAADVVVAAETARFVSAYSAIGLSPDCGVSARLSASVGARRAAQFLLLNQTWTAREAYEAGLVTQVVPDDGLEGAVAEVVAALAARPGRSAGEAARLLRRAPERSLVEQLEDEAETISRLVGEPAGAALVAGFGSA